MGANPVWVSINPRKEGECFSLPSETQKIEQALNEFENEITSQFTSSWDMWVDAGEDVARRFSQDYPDYRFYIRTECDAFIEYYSGKMEVRVAVMPQLLRNVYHEGGFSFFQVNEMF